MGKYKIGLHDYNTHSPCAYMNEQCASLSSNTISQGLLICFHFIIFLVALAFVHARSYDFNITIYKIDNY